MVSIKQRLFKYRGMQDTVESRLLNGQKAANWGWQDMTESDSVEVGTP